MISLMDKYIGQILDKLDELGLAENTLVVFTTDHGHFFGQHGLIAKGAFHYEDMVKIPIVARFPGAIPAGERSPTPCSPWSTMPRPSSASPGSTSRAR